MVACVGTVKMTVLVDDKAANGLEAEHGLSLWIEADDRRILFDTGQTAVLTRNADRLGIALDRTDILVLSHGHHDHTGAVHEVIRRSDRVTTYCHPGAVVPRYSRRDGRTRPIGMPEAASTNLGAIPPERVVWVAQPCELFRGAGVTGAVLRTTAFEAAGGLYYLDPAGTLVDRVEDDMALWLSTCKGLVVCVGCCHAGLINTLNQVRRCSQTPRIHALVGGFHMSDASDERMRRTLGALVESGVDRLIPCHCTGERFIEKLRLEFGDRTSPGQAGATYVFGNGASECTPEP